MFMNKITALLSVTNKKTSTSNTFTKFDTLFFARNKTLREGILSANWNGRIEKNARDASRLESVNLRSVDGKKKRIPKYRWMDAACQNNAYRLCFDTEVRRGLQNVKKAFWMELCDTARWSTPLRMNSVPKSSDIPAYWSVAHNSSVYDKTMLPAN